MIKIPVEAQKTPEDVEKDWIEFWLPIVSGDDGEPDIEKIKRELADFHFVMKEVSKVYCHITGGLLSKVNYRAETVIEHADRHYEDCYM
jgi:hypothetical protein